jgi:UDP-glucose 4-epimerase
MDRIYGILSARLRYFNAAGATVERGEDHRPPELHIIPLTLKVALWQRESISVFGGDWPTLDGSPVRDFVHVSDLARAHILALAGVEKGSVFYNSGRNISGAKEPALA